MTYQQKIDLINKSLSSSWPMRLLDITAVLDDDGVKFEGQHAHLADYPYHIGDDGMDMDFAVAEIERSVRVSLADQLGSDVRLVLYTEGGSSGFSGHVLTLHDALGKILDGKKLKQVRVQIEIGHEKVAEIRSDLLGDDVVTGILVNMDWGNVTMGRFLGWGDF
jgi:hypothetical protein